jgi:hypothetical protein
MDVLGLGEQCIGAGVWLGLDWMDHGSRVKETCDIIFAMPDPPFPFGSGRAARDRSTRSLSQVECMITAMKCIDCNQDMTTVDGCTLPTLTIAGVAHNRRHWGKERRWPRPKQGERCGDCGALPTQLHHLGCDIEECPQCRRQLISCGCWTDEPA